MLRFPNITCFFDRCSKPVTFECKCSCPVTYSCSRHIKVHAKHLMENHHILPLSMTFLEGQLKIQVLSKLKESKINLKKLKQSSIESSFQILNHLSKTLGHFIKDIDTLIESMNNIIKRINNEKPVSDSFILGLKSDLKPYVPPNKRIIQKISELYSTKPTFTDDFIFLAKLDDPSLYSINLTTLKSSVFANLSKFWRCGTACKINKHEYFFTGGIHNSSRTYYDHTSIIDIINKTEVVVKSHTAAIGHSSVYKDNRVYVFGGFNDEGNLSSAKVFDLNFKEWGILANLPTPSSTCSTLIEDKIVIAGYYFGCVYIFDQNTYVKNIGLNHKKQFYACGKWIFCWDELYKCNDLEKMQWSLSSIRVKDTSNTPPINIAYKKKKYIYFLVSPDELWRIDTVAKQSEKLNYN